MPGNPYDLNRDGRWSTPERAFTHYGIADELKRADEKNDRPAGSCLVGCGGCLVAVALLVLAATLLAGALSSCR